MKEEDNAPGCKEDIYYKLTSNIKFNDDRMAQIGRITTEYHNNVKNATQESLLALNKKRDKIHDNFLMKYNKIYEDWLKTGGL